MTRTVAKRSIMVSDHKTSISLEEAFWVALRDIAADRGITIAQLVTQIDKGRTQANLSSAIRLFVLDHFVVLAETADAGDRQSR